MLFVTDIYSNCITFQGEIRYNTLGFYPATDYFRLNEVSGAITLYRTVRDEQYQSLIYVVSLHTSVFFTFVYNQRKHWLNCKLNKMNGTGLFYFVILDFEITYFSVHEIETV